MSSRSNVDRWSKVWFGSWLLSSWLWVGDAAAAIRGLVMGADEYPNLVGNNLAGAVNDAKDIAKALQGVHATDVIVLTNEQVNREKIFAAWERLLQASTAGDVLVMSYAGHGIQVKEQVAGSETDGFDEAFALAAYATSGPKSSEVLLDNEIAVFLQQASQADVRVLFIADACHSGTMTRSIDPVVRPVKFRALPSCKKTIPPSKSNYRGIAMVTADAAAEIEVQELPGIVYAGAVQDHQLAPETIIDGQSRGALSWSVANAIRGLGDMNSDSKITSAEIADYVRETVRTRMEGAQEPSVSQPRGISFVLLDESSAAHTKTMTPVTKPVSLAIKNALTEPAILLAGLVDAQEAEAQSALLTWDVARGEVLNSLGHVVANVHVPTRGFERDPKPCAVASPSRKFERDKSSTRSSKKIETVAAAAVKKARTQDCGEAKVGEAKDDLPQVQKVLNKWQLVEMLKPYTERMPLTVTMDEPNGNKLYINGSKVSLSISGQQYPYFTLFNLASDGEISLLYPIVGDGNDDPLEIPLGQPYSVNLKVSPPFGADHFVALASAKPLEQLHTTLQSFNGKVIKDEFVQVIKDTLQHADNMQVAIHGVYTAAKKQ